MEDENEYKKLATEDKCVHKLWKARVQGYEEAIKLFNQIDDEKSPEWNKYLGLIKKFVTDSNAVAQEKGLEAALVFVENCFQAGKTTGDVMSGIVTKCIAAARTKTKALALQVTLMYVEIEKHEIVQEELTKGMDHKNPKIVSACVAAVTDALKQFGNKVITIKPLVKKIPVLLTDRDKGVRDEGKALVVEMHRWIGGAIEPHLATLQAVVQQELREAFGSAPAPRPTRYLRSQQSRMSEVADAGDDDGDGAADEDDGDAGAGDLADVDPYELLDPVEILSRIPKDFYDKLEAKKWQDRKEALDALENILKTAPKLEPGDYADLVRALKKVISKDSNVMLVALGGRLLGAVAAGLRNKFQPYAVACIQAILEKFKEKKTNVVTALRDASDIIYPCTNLEAIMEDVLEAFNNKNPSVKTETALFLARGLCRTQPAALNKKLLKAYVGGLLKLLESAEPSVRDSAAEALGTAIKLVGEKNVAPHIGKLDNLKEQKIKEFTDKAVIQVKIAGPKKEAKSKAATSGKGDVAKPVAGSAQPKPVKRPATANKKAAVGASAKKPVAVRAAPVRESELSQEEVDQHAEDLFTAEIIAGLADTNWKTRLSSVQSFQSTVQGLSPGDASAQILFRTINKKPGLKDTNVQVLKCRLESVKYISESFPLSTTSVDFVLQDVVTKLGDAGCSVIASDTLTILSESGRLEHVVNESLSFAMDQQKNPKVQSELYNWLATAIKEFGFTISIKPLITHSKKAIVATNPTVRSSSINFLGVLSLFVGPSLINHFDSEKPALKQLISLELDKYANSTPPTPTRGITKSASKGSMGEDLDEAGSLEEACEEEVAPQPDNTTRTDMAPLITEALIVEINDKNWKARNEALEKLKGIISTSSPIKSSLGELPAALAARLLDSNSKLAQMALQICEMLAHAMGPKCKVHVRTFFPGFFQAFGDSKQWIRKAAGTCLDAWCSEAGGAHVAFEGEMVFDALKTGSPVMRAELFQWLAIQIPTAAPKSFPREELSVCVPVLFSCIEDRVADVRRCAADCVLPFMLHLGYDAMHKQLDKLKPGSKSAVQAALDKARPNLPVQPLPKSKKEEGRGVKSAGALKKEGEKKSAVAPPAGKAKGIVKPTSAVSRTKKEDEDFTPLMPTNNAKNQRIIDDQKLKVLKWNFVVPREEFFELLKEQMTTAGVNKQLIGNMFHKDFRYHLKAIESLSDDLPENGSALMCNLDLVLKWLTLRFFDTNPSVILKGLEYLSLVFNYLMDSDYTMAEYEANCFIPYLVLKVGDPKDTVRNGVKALFKQICVVYSVTKLFGYLMEGLKSKNARQRTECLECIGHLMESYGSNVMSPTPSAALKELARHIGDRDNGVRSATLNCITNAYFLEGEKVYKMIGQISDKDLSLLEERIKRAAKTKSAENRRSMVLPLSVSGKPLARQPSDPAIMEEEAPRHAQISVETTPGAEYEDEPEDGPPPPQTYTKKGVETGFRPVTEQESPTVLLIAASQEKISGSQPSPPPVRNQFALDPELIAQLDAMVKPVKKFELPEMDISYLYEPIVMPNFRSNVRSNLLPMSPPRRMNPALSMNNDQSLPANIDDSLLVDTIHSVASPNLAVAVRAMSLINSALHSGRGAALAAYEERLARSASQQVRLIRSGAHPSSETLSAYKFLSTMLTSFYEVGACGRAVSSSALSPLLSELLRVLGGAGGPGCALDSGDGERLVRVLNNVCVRLLDHSEHSELLCTLLSLLHESIGVSDPAYPRYQDLLMKCFWKTLKMISTWDVNSIDYDAVLLKIHLFYKAYPNSYWKKNADMSDTPYRTVKTLVHTLVKMKGSSITNHLTQIPDAQETDLYAYLHKVFKQLKLEDKKDTEANGSSVLTSVGTGAGGGGTRLPRAVHEELATILRSIGNKQHNKDALTQLYDLRERHPNVDIWTFMQGSSFYFRNYVERGLKEVAEQRRRGNCPMYATTADYAVDPNVAEAADENDENLHLVFLERLRKLQVKAGMRTESTPNSQPRTPIIDNKTLTDSINENSLPRPRNIDPQLELHSSQSMTQRNEADVDALRLKLQQIKSSSKR